MVDPDGYLQPKRYRITYECARCGTTYFRTLKAVPKKDPPCPNRACIKIDEMEDLRKQVANLQAMLESGKAPGVIGDKAVVQAIDKTAEITMREYNLTDLKDNIREGETVMPKLPAEQQKQADSYFSGGSHVGMNQRQMQALQSQAVNGAFRNLAVDPMIVAPKGGGRGKSPLVHVGTESIRKH